MSVRTQKTKEVIVESVSNASSLKSSLTAMSPTMISRVQEKNELASLNDRLATYIERVQMLESDNSRLTLLVQTQEYVTIKEVQGVKVLYQSELANVRQLLDELAKDKATLQLQNGKLKSEVEVLHAKLSLCEKDISAAEKKLLTAESQAAESIARANDAVGQYRHWKEEHSKLKKEFDMLNKGLITAKKQLEDETMMRVDLENHILSLKEDLLFKSQVHEQIHVLSLLPGLGDPLSEFEKGYREAVGSGVELQSRTILAVLLQELSECMKRSQTYVEGVNEGLKRDYDNKLGESLVRMREDMEEQLRRACQETENVLERKLTEIHSLAEQNICMSEKAQTDSRNSQKRLDELSSEVSRLTAQNQEYHASIRDLRLERDSLNIDKEVLNNEVERLRGEIEDHVVKYRDLMDVKVKLDNEISVYRKLLESEEARLKLSVVETTPGPLLLHKRRKMDEDVATFSAVSKNNVEESLASSEFEVISSAKEMVKISEISTDGQFIKLFNSSNDKKVALGGWQLHHTCGAWETKYKFPRNTFLKPQQYVTIWSSTSGQTHSPPTNLVLTNQVWHFGDHMTTVLLDLKRKEMASHEMKKAAVSTSSQAAQAEQQTHSERKSWGWSLFSIVM